jgi:hypothetical protein
MRRLWRRGEKVDWKPWNQALALISLVATPAAIAAAEKMDATLRSVRPDFINVAREEIVEVRHGLKGLPIILPPVRLGTNQTGTPATRDDADPQG